MITIIKDGNKIKCSQNTYDTMYKRLGYEILVDKEPIVVETKVLEDTKKEEIIMPKTNTRGRGTRGRTKKGE